MKLERFKVGLLSLVMIYLLWQVAGLSFSFIERHFPQYFEKPLTMSTALALCNMLKLQADGHPCDGSTVYDFDFYDSFRERYTLRTPRHQIDGEIGAYLYNCADWEVTFSDGTFQDCYYDFQKGGAFQLQIVYRIESENPEEDEGEAWDRCTTLIRNLVLVPSRVCNAPATLLWFDTTSIKDP